MFIQASKTSLAVFISLIFNMTIASFPGLPFSRSFSGIQSGERQFRPFLDKSRFSFGKRKWSLSKKPSNSVCVPGMQGVCWIGSLTSILKKVICKLHLRADFHSWGKGISQRVCEENKYSHHQYPGPKWIFPELYFRQKSWWEERSLQCLYFCCWQGCGLNMEAVKNA